MEKQTRKQNKTKQTPPPKKDTFGKDNDNNYLTSRSLRWYSETS